MNAIINSFFLLFLTIVLIVKGYQYYKIKWPERYFGPDDKSSIFISTNFRYYISFRLLPIFAAIFAIVGTSYKASPNNIINPIVLGAIIGFVYSVISDGRVILELLLNSLNVKIFVNKTSQYAIHFITIVLLTTIGGLAGYVITINEIQFLLPQLNGLVDNVWASFISIVVAYSLFSFIKKPREIELEGVINKSAKQINPRLVRLIENLSEKNNADPTLVKTICIAENMQRPSWIRRLENILGCFKREATYGIMQVTSKRPISDEESIKRAVEQFFKDSSHMSFNKKIKSVERYNSDEKYIFLVEEIYRYITPES